MKNDLLRRLGIGTLMLTTGILIGGLNPQFGHAHNNEKSSKNEKFQENQLNENLYWKNKEGFKFNEQVIENNKKISKSYVVTSWGEILKVEIYNQEMLGKYLIEDLAYIITIKDKNHDNILDRIHLSDFINGSDAEITRSENGVLNYIGLDESQAKEVFDLYTKGFIEFKKDNKISEKIEKYVRKLDIPPI